MTWERNLSSDERDFLNKIKRYKHKEKQDEPLSVSILKVVLVGGYLASCFVAPGLSQIHKIFMGNDERYCRRFYKTIRRLRKRGLIEEKEGKFYVTNKGRILLRLREIRDFNLVRDKNNRNKMLIVFDIPESKKFARNELRKILLKNGYKMVQRSVYVSDCAHTKSSFQDLSSLLDIKGKILISSVIS